MPRASKSRSKTKAKSTGAGRSTSRTRTSATAARSSVPKAQAGTDVEARWNEYWECRQSLEEAIASVRTAQEQLAAAQELERNRREAFDRTKNELKRLLEVDPAKPVSNPAEKRGPTLLGLAEDAEDAEDLEEDEESSG